MPSHIRKTLQSIFSRVSHQKSHQKEFKHLVEFRPEEKRLLRASDVSKVLHFGGHIFRNSVGSAATYSLSDEVESVDAFISHNWVVPRFHKFVALCMTFNIKGAFIVWISSMMVIAVANGFHVLPVMNVQGLNYPLGIMSKILAVPIFMFTLFLGREVGLALGHRGAMVFLDKTCIHQENKDLQQHGIRKLGAFLGNSKTMVVLYTNLYLKKLWTVYEVASFLSLSSTDQFVFVPIFLTLFVAGSMAILGFTNIVLMVVVSITQTEWYATSSLGITSLMEIFVVAILRMWKHEQQSMQSTLANFSVKNCTCFDENDRLLVYNNIVALMKGAGLVSANVGEEEALVAFDTLVRNRLPVALRARIGRIGLPYHYAVMMAMSVFPPGAFDRIALMIAAGEPTTEVLLYTVVYASMTLNMFPQQVAIWSMLTGYCLHLKGFTEQCFNLLVLVLGIVPPAFLTFQYILFKDAEFILLYFGLNCAITAAIYCRCAACCSEGKSMDDSSGVAEEKGSTIENSINGHFGNKSTNTSHDSASNWHLKSSEHLERQLEEMLQVAMTAETHPSELQQVCSSESVYAARKLPERFSL